MLTYKKLLIDFFIINWFKDYLQNIPTPKMNQKYLNLTQIKQNKSENKSLMCKPLIAEEPVDATTTATSKMNSENDFEMSQHYNE